MTKGTSSSRLLGFLSVLLIFAAVAPAAASADGVTAPVAGLDTTAVVGTVATVPAAPGVLPEGSLPYVGVPTFDLGSTEVWITTSKPRAPKAKTKRGKARRLQQTCGGGGCILKEVELTKVESFPGFNPCPGINEPMLVNGNSKVHFFLHIDGSGGIHQIDMTRVAQGTGLTATGVKYAYGTNFMQKFNFPEPTFNTTIHIRDRAVRQGELTGIGDDFFLYQELHMTQNASGETTSFFSDIGDPFECR